MTFLIRGKLVSGSSGRAWGLGGWRLKPKGFWEEEEVGFRRRWPVVGSMEDEGEGSRTTSTSSVRQSPAP